ncbi:MAG: transcription antitermination factor NusB [Ferruginibacter sp.]|nr:transcription antitermination factor NusB [Ferruginibacter sp.]
MISRRNIRVKVMQTLYSLESFSDDLKTGEQEAILKEKVNQTKSLFTYLIYFLTEVARYAETDSIQKASKLLPTSADLNVNIKISGNELLWKILEDSSFKQSVKTYRSEYTIDEELVKKIYNQLSIAEEYKEYTETSSREKKSERKILEFIFSKLMLPNEDFTQHIEERFINWDDDAELLNLLVLNYLNKPGSHSFMDLLSKEKWDFAKDLLKTVLEKKSFTLELIKPKLNNWDADRIASLDLILLQMGVCEFLYFETIPTKVTINEYIDLAKSYSTPQSGQFVNGLLDNIHKELSAQNKIHKKIYKNSTL